MAGTSEVASGEDSRDEYVLLAEQAVSLDKAYITSISVKRQGVKFKSALALSNNTCIVYNLTNTQMTKESIIKEHQDTITGVKWSPESDSLLYTSSLDGCICLWDLRDKKSVRKFGVESDSSKVKPLSCFDVSHDDLYLAAGTEVVGSDAFTLFWDARNCKLLGAYWDSHSDEMTQVVFQPSHNNTIASSSMDGLVNIFDIKESSEEDALQYTLNTDSGVNKIRWQTSNKLTCITDLDCLQFWDIEGEAPDISITRGETAQAIGAAEDDAYVVDAYSVSADNTLVLAGSNSGKGECLKVLTSRKNKIEKVTDVVGNLQIVRCCEYFNQDDLLFTAGEGGIVSVWNRKPKDINSSSARITDKTNARHKSKPYAKH